MLAGIIKLQKRGISLISLRKRAKGWIFLRKKGICLFWPPHRLIHLILNHGLDQLHLTFVGMNGYSPYIYIYIYTHKLTFMSFYGWSTLYKLYKYMKVSLFWLYLVISTSLISLSIWSNV